MIACHISSRTVCRVRMLKHERDKCSGGLCNGKVVGFLIDLVLMLYMTTSKRLSDRPNSKGFNCSLRKCSYSLGEDIGEVRWRS